METFDISSGSSIFLAQFFSNHYNVYQDDNSNYCSGDVKMVDLVVLGSDNHFPAGKPITGDH